MPLFRYQADNSAGQRMTGAIDAADEADLRSRLSYSQLKLVAYKEVDISVPGKPRTPTPPPPPVQMSPAPPVPKPSPVTTSTVGVPASSGAKLTGTVQRGPMVGTVAPSAPISQSLTPPPAPQIAIKHTRKSKPKELFFLFSQLGSYVNSGQSIAVGLESLAQRTSSPMWREVYMDCVQQMQNGSDFARAMSHYPDLFPPYAIGCIQAGERGGFLPQACAMVRDKAKEDNVMNTWVKWTWAGFWVLLFPCFFALPLMDGFFNGFKQSWENSQTTGIMPMVMGKMWAVFFHQTLPVMLGVAAIYWVLMRGWMSDKNRVVRHRVPLLMQGFKQRGKNEALSMFAWALSGISRAGIAPREAAMLAAACVPNMAMRAEMEAGFQNMATETKLSDALGNSKYVPDEFMMVASTGEMTGDVAGQMAQLSISSKEEMNRMGAIVKFRFIVWIVLLGVIGTAFVFWVFYGRFYGKLFQFMGDQ